MGLLGSPNILTCNPLPIRFPFSTTRAWNLGNGSTDLVSQVVYQVLILKNMYCVSIELYKYEWKFGRTRNAVGTRAAGECFHSAPGTLCCVLEEDTLLLSKPVMDLNPIQGGVEILLVALYYRNRRYAPA